MSVHNRWLRVVLVMSLILPGLALGTWLGGRFLVPAGSGLAGAPIALGYGLLAAVVLALVAILVSARLPRPWLVRLNWIAGALSIAILVMIGRGMMQSSEQQQRHLEQAYQRLPPFSLQLLMETPATDPRFTAIRYDSRQGLLTAEHAAGGECTASVAGSEKVALLTSLRNAEVLTARQPSPCTDNSPVRFHLSWRIKDPQPPASEGDLNVTAACLSQHPELQQTLDAARSLLRERGATGRCQ